MKLAKLLSDLTEWRNGGRLGQKVPKELRERAVELLGEYKISEILKTLGINVKTFTSWKEENTSEINCEPVFISLPPGQKEKKVLAENLSLKLSHGSWSLEGNLSLKSWQNAIRLLEGVR